MRNAKIGFRAVLIAAGMLMLGSGPRESEGAATAQTLRCVDCIEYQLVLVTPMEGYYNYTFIKWRHEMMGTDCDDQLFASRRAPRLDPLIRLAAAIQGEPWEEDIYWDEICAGCGVTSSCNHAIEDGKCHVECGEGDGGEQQQMMTNQLRAGVKSASAEDVVDVIKRYPAVAHYNPARNAVQLTSLCNPDGPLVDQVRMDPALARRVEALLAVAE
jgi:hypothetical protein